ncbi:MAG: T9SS type A sorting domain-containing protein, partial [Bacteroidota bacterium]|nr:T9SS type A sorting domain-containing protein [Bacteroidota bacterium]
EESINVYPNPSTGIVNIDLKGAMTQNATLEVFNAMGQKVLSQIYTDAVGKFEIDLSGNAKGVYNIKLIVDGQVVSKLIVLQ